MWQKHPLTEAGHGMEMTIDEWCLAQWAWAAHCPTQGTQVHSAVSQGLPGLKPKRDRLGASPPAIGRPLQADSAQDANICNACLVKEIDSYLPGDNEFQFVPNYLQCMGEWHLILVGVGLEH